jgi:hypothetical protein
MLKMKEFNNSFNAKKVLLQYLVFVQILDVFSITNYIKIDSFTTEYTFQKAVNICASLNATVLLIEDSTENNYIIEII